MDRLSLTALLTICFLYVHDGEALKCHVCNSKQDSRCLNPDDESSKLELIDCSNDQKQRMETRQAIETISVMLQKLGSPSIQLSTDRKPSQIWEKENFPMACQKVELEVQGDLVVGRGCSAPRMEGFDPCEAIKLITTKDIVLQSCSICDSHGCNKGIPVASVSLGLFGAVLALLLAS